MCPHHPHCPAAEAPDAAAARIVSEHLQDAGYALLCNGAILLEGDGLLAGPDPGGLAACAPGSGSAQ